jgi:hypothetical protein
METADRQALESESLLWLEMRTPVNGDRLDTAMNLTSQHIYRTLFRVSIGLYFPG